MSVITAKKEISEIGRRLMDRGDLHIVVMGCDKCAKTSGTGGTEQVREMKEHLRGSGLMMLEVEGLVDAVEEGLCDPKAVSERLGCSRNKNRTRSWCSHVARDFCACATHCPE